MAVLNLALPQLPDYRCMVIRPDNLPLSMLFQYQFGSMVEYPAFTSTTGGKHIVLNEKSPHWLMLHAKHAKPIDWIGKYPKENEVLFAAPIRFKVNTTPEVNQKTGLLEIKPKEINETFAKFAH